MTRQCHEHHVGVLRDHLLQRLHKIGVITSRETWVLGDQLLRRLQGLLPLLPLLRLKQSIEILRQHRQDVDRFEQVHRVDSVWFVRFVTFTLIIIPSLCAGLHLGAEVLLGAKEPCLLRLLPGGFLKLRLQLRYLRHEMEPVLSTSRGVMR